MSQKMDCGQIMSVFQIAKRQNGRRFVYTTKSRQYKICG